MMSEQMRRLVQDKMPNAKLIFAYGMTEVGGIVSETFPEDPLSSSVGKPAINTQIKILIDDGSIGDFFEIGEILIKKPMKFLGYIGSRHKSIMDKGELITT
jgi:long-subunit acyl-CoA synthetase (AMP-forming)